MTPQDAFRLLWSEFINTCDDEERELLENEMDMLQPFICYGPGKEWHEFANTLIGFWDHWASIRTQAYRDV